MSGVCPVCVRGVSGVCKGCVRGVSGVCQGCVSAQNNAIVARVGCGRHYCTQSKVPVVSPW